MLSFSCHFGILKGGVFSSKHLHLYIYVFQLVVHGLNPWETLCPAIFFLRKKGPHMKAVLATHTDSCMWAAVAAWVTWMSVYKKKVEVDLLAVHLALLSQLLAFLQGWASLTREKSILCLNLCLESWITTCTNIEC